MCVCVCVCVCVLPNLINMIMVLNQKGTNIHQKIDDVCTE